LFLVLVTSQLIPRQPLPDNLPHGDIEALAVIQAGAVIVTNACSSK
jgi:hypothetical protein